MVLSPAGGSPNCRVVADNETKEGRLMRFSLRSLMIAGLIGPPILAAVFHYYREYGALSVYLWLAVMICVFGWWLNERPDWTPP